MPGVRDGNLRGGDLCEGFGLELLRPFAFVAPTPRPEDVGFDAVATLTRRDGRRLFAEDSFLVQVKAASVRTIEFKGKALDWLRALKLPLLLLSVDMATTTLELRSFARAFTHPNYRDRTGVTFFLDETPFDLPGEEMRVWLGPPLLRWTPADAANGDFQQTAYEVLKAWNTFEVECISLRSLGMSRQVKWDTNHKPEPDGGFMIMSHPRELQSVLETISPHIQWLATMIFAMEGKSDDLLMGLLLVSRFMRRQGVNPDPIGILPALAKLRLDSHGERDRHLSRT
jgi:hypothetical protein